MFSFVDFTFKLYGIMQMDAKLTAGNDILNLTGLYVHTISKKYNGLAFLHGDTIKFLCRCYKYVLSAN